MTNRDHLELPATVDNIARFREFAARSCALAGGNDDDGFAIRLAVDEVCSNIIEHGYPNGGRGSIELIAESGGREVTIVIVDTGRPFRPEDAPEPDLEAGWEQRPVGGLGWHLIRQMVDDVRYESGPDGNRLTLVKLLGQRPEKGENNDGSDG